MKQFLFIICLSIVYLFGYGQSFEGEVIYQTTFKSKTPDMTDQQFASMINIGKDFFVKGGNFKYETQGILQQLYINADNKLYNRVSNSEILIWNDASVDQVKVISTKLQKNVTNILGYMCDEIILNCSDGIHKYYFTSKLPIDSKLYAKCLVGNWYAYLSKSNAIPLKIVFENEQVTMATTAIAVKPMILDKSLFTLPADVKTTESGF